jgi:hypothetical protein
VVGLCGQLGADEASVAQHSDAVGELEDLGHTVRDVADGDALVAQALDEGEEDGGLVLAERGGRLVKADDARLVDEHAHDLDELSLSGRKLAAEGFRTDQPLEAVVAQVGLSTRVDGALVEYEAAAREGADVDVLGNRDMLQDLGLLRDDAQSGYAGLARVGEVDGLAAQLECSGVGLVVAREDLEQRGLARAVLAHDRSDLAGT